MKHLDQLPPRQKEICGLILKGYDYHEIASLLGITYSGVHSQKTPAYKRLGVKSDLQFFALILRQRLTEARSMGEKIDTIEGMLDEVAP